MTAVGGSGVQVGDLPFGLRASAISTVIRPLQLGFTIGAEDL